LSLNGCVALRRQAKNARGARTGKKSGSFSGTSSCKLKPYHHHKVYRPQRNTGQHPTQGRAACRFGIARPSIISPRLICRPPSRWVETPSVATVMPRLAALTKWASQIDSPPGPIKTRANSQAAPAACVESGGKLISGVCGGLIQHQCFWRSLSSGQRFQA